MKIEKIEQKIKFFAPARGLVEKRSQAK